MSVLVRGRVKENLKSYFESTVRLGKEWVLKGENYLSGDEETGIFAGQNVQADKFFKPMFDNKPRSDAYLSYLVSDDYDVRVCFNEEDDFGRYVEPMNIDMANRYISYFRKGLNLKSAKNIKIVFPPKGYFELCDKLKKGKTLSKEEWNRLKKMLSDS